MANKGSPAGGRPLGFEPAQVLDRVVETFWVNGYDATTTTLLEEATGLSRSSLLNTFGPKEQLLVAAVDRYQSMMDSGLLDPMLNGERGLADLDRFFTGPRRCEGERAGIERLSRCQPGRCWPD